MRTSFQTLGSWGLLLALSLMLLSCGEETTPPERSFEPLTTDITAGPAEDAAIPYGAAVTFSWIGTGGKVPISGYAYALSDGPGTDDSLAFSDWGPVTTMTFRDLPEGDYTFHVKAYGDTAGWDGEPEELQYYVQLEPTSRDFRRVGEDDVPPLLWISEGPAEGSKHATGSWVTFVWDAVDSTGAGEGSVVGYTYALDNPVGGTWENWDITTTATFVDLDNGDHTFYVRAMDGADNQTLVERSFVVMTPTILLVDNATDGAATALSIVEEAALDKWYRDYIVKDYAWEEWDTAEKGWPTAADLAPYSTVVWYNNYTGNYADLSDPLAEYLDGGGNLWLSDYENLWAYDSIGPGTFPTDYLFVSEFIDEPDLEEAFGLVTGYPDLKVFASPMTNGDSYIYWVDEVGVAAGAEAVYAHNDPAGNACALRATGVGAAGSGRVVFFTFPLWPMPPVEMREVAVQVLTHEFGE
jgi:hypothetical protein